MGRSKAAVPAYRHQKSRRLAVVTIDGRDIYLGKYNSPESKAEYARLLAEYAVTGRVTRPSDGEQGRDEITVEEVIAAYWQHAEGYYVKNGKPTKELPAVKTVLRPVRELYGDKPASELGPLAIKAIRQQWIEAGHTRGTINRDAQRIVRVFRWAASEELVPVTVSQSLATVSGLRRGRTNAKESKPVRPVDLKTVELTMEHLCPVVADMVRVQRHTKATEIRKRFGLDAAQVILGHSFADVTQIYAERDAEKAREVARAIG